MDEDQMLGRIKDEQAAAWQDGYNTAKEKYAPRKWGQEVAQEARDELRAKVDLWHDNAEATYRSKGDHYYEGAMDAYGAVLGLLDGDGDEPVR